MEEIYRAIEQKIKDAGFLREVSGMDVYDDICEQIDDKEPGTYLCISKFFDDVIFEYTIVVMEEEFNEQPVMENLDGFGLQDENGEDIVMEDDDDSYASDEEI